MLGAHRAGLVVVRHAGEASHGAAAALVVPVRNTGAGGGEAVALHGSKAGPPRAGPQTAAHAQEVAVPAVRQEKSLEGTVGSNPSASGLAEADLDEAVWPRPRRIITVVLARRLR